MNIDPRTSMMRLRAVLLLAASIAVALGGCARIEDTARDTARDAVTRAATAAAGEVKEQICNLTQDGLVSAQDKELLAGLIPAARTAGVPEEVLAPADQIAKAGDAVPEEALGKLRGTCGQEPAPSPS
jgi:hypothetical protein